MDLVASLKSVFLTALVLYSPDVRSTPVQNTLAQNKATLFQGATVVTFNTSTNTVDTRLGVNLLVEGDCIQGIYTGAVPSIYHGATVIDASDKIICPGFINTHQHLWQTAWRTIASNTTLMEYFARYSQFAAASSFFSTDDVYLSQIMGLLELVNEGTTTVLDHAHAAWSDDYVDVMLDAHHDSGVRGFYGPAIQPIGPSYPVADQISKIKALSNDKRVSHSSTVSIGVAYDTFAVAPADEVAAVHELVSQNDISFVTTHYVGGLVGADNSPEVLQPQGFLNITDVPVIFSHASFISPNGARILRDSNHYISTTPESEAHYGHLNPHGHLIQDQTSIGVDTHFTFSSSMVTQARLWLQELRKRVFTKSAERWIAQTNNAMSVNQAFTLITHAGAQALRRDDLGVIAPGAKADLVIFDGTSPNMLAWSDAVAAIMLHSNPGDITDVMVGGVFVKRDGKLTHPNLKDIRKRFVKSAKRIQDIWLDMPLPVFEAGSAWAGGLATFGHVDHIDALRGEGTGY